MVCTYKYIYIYISVYTTVNSHDQLKLGPRNMTESIYVVRSCFNKLKLNL